MGPPPNLPDDGLIRQQLEQLNELLQMSPQQLRRIRETIEMIERMSPEERSKLRTRLQEFINLSPDLQQEIKELAQQVDPGQRSLLRQYWMSLRPEERSAMLEQLHAMSDEEVKSSLRTQLNSFRKEREEAFEAMRREKTPGPPPSFEPGPPPNQPR